MTSGTENSDGSHEEQTDTSSPAWLRATTDDLANLDFEGPIADSKSADSHDLSDIFRAAAGEDEDTPAARLFRMLSAATGMLFKPTERNEPFGAMLIFDGRRSAIPADFQGAPAEVLAAAAERAVHPTLRARLADLSWVLDRKKGRLAVTAVAAYAEIVTLVDSGLLEFRFDKGQGALKQDARDLLRRALQIGRGVGWDKSEVAAARELVVELRARSIEDKLPVPAFWFSELDLDFGVSDPDNVSRDIEALIVGGLPANVDGHSLVELWRLAARGYHLSKREEDKHRAQSAAAEQFVLMAERQPNAMMASSFLSDAISELHGIPGQKERRKELRHRLIDVQAGVSEEMSLFSYPLDLRDMAEDVEKAISHLRLYDKLFVFAELDRSPNPAKLAANAAKSIREHPLRSLFGASYHDSEGKVIHRTQGAGFGEETDDPAIQQHIAQDEDIRRRVAAMGAIEIARQVIARDHFLSDDLFTRMLVYSPFVPSDLVMTYSHGFLRFFQGDFVSSLYILTPLLESSLRHVLKAHGHDVTIFDDATQTQQDRTISSLFEQMRDELDAVFGVAITTDIENVFLKKPGPHLRHALSHGLVHDGDPYGHNAIYACWFIFHLCLIPLVNRRDQLQFPFDEPTTEMAPAS